MVQFMSFRQVQLYDLPLQEQLIRKPKNSRVTMMAFRLWGYGEDFQILTPRELVASLCSVGCRAPFCAQGGTVHSVQFFKQNRRMVLRIVRSSCASWLKWKVKPPTSLYTSRGSMGLSWRAFSHKSKGMGCHIKAFLPATCLAQKETWLQTKCSYIILSEAYFLLLSFWQDNL